jgi:uncharacterized membrane protein
MSNMENEEPPKTTPADPNRTLMLVLAYLGPLCLVPLLIDKEDREVRWHARNGLVFFAAWVAIFVLNNFLFLSLHPLGCLITLLMPIVGLAYMALVVAGIVRALEGKRLVVPGLSALADRF